MPKMKIGIVAVSRDCFPESVVLLLGDTVRLDEQAAPMVEVRLGILGDGVLLRVEEQQVFAESLVVFLACGSFPSGSSFPAG